MDEFAKVKMINEESLKDVWSVDELVTYGSEVLNEGQKDCRHVVNIELVNQGTLSTYSSKLIEATERNTRALEKSRKTVVDNSLMISILRWAIERYKQNKDLRVEARQEYDRKMDDDRRDRKIKKGCGAKGREQREN